MKKTVKPDSQFSLRASLAVVGVNLRALDLFGSIKYRVRIQQKTAKYSPVDTFDCFR